MTVGWYLGMGGTKTLGDFFWGRPGALGIGGSLRNFLLFRGSFYRDSRKAGTGVGLNALWITLGNALIGGLGAWLSCRQNIARRIGQNLDTMTMPRFLQERYGANI